MIKRLRHIGDGGDKVENLALLPVTALAGLALVGAACFGAEQMSFDPSSTWGHGMEGLYAIDAGSLFREGDGARGKEDPDLEDQLSVALLATTNELAGSASQFSDFVLRDGADATVTVPAVARDGRDLPGMVDPAASNPSAHKNWPDPDAGLPLPADLYPAKETILYYGEGFAGLGTERFQFVTMEVLGEDDLYLESQDVESTGLQPLYQGMELDEDALLHAMYVYFWFVDPGSGRGYVFNRCRVMSFGENAVVEGYPKRIPDGVKSVDVRVRLRQDASSWWMDVDKTLPVHRCKVVVRTAAGKVLKVAYLNDGESLDLASNVGEALGVAAGEDSAARFAPLAKVLPGWVKAGDARPVAMSYDAADSGLVTLVPEVPAAVPAGFSVALDKETGLQTLVAYSGDAEKCDIPEGVQAVYGGGSVVARAARIAIPKTMRRIEGGSLVARDAFEVEEGNEVYWSRGGVLMERASEGGEEGSCVVAVPTSMESAPAVTTMAVVEEAPADAVTPCDDAASADDTLLADAESADASSCDSAPAAPSPVAESATE